MKLVCINNQNANLTIGKAYDVISFITVEPNGKLIELPIGSGSSRILMESLYKSLFVGNLRKDVKVKIKNDDDFLIHWTYDVSLFKTLEEWRDTKLEELGI
jgi:hypothetical protein